MKIVRNPRTFAYTVLLAYSVIDKKGLKFEMKMEKLWLLEFLDISPITILSVAVMIQRPKKQPHSYPVPT